MPDIHMDFSIDDIPDDIADNDREYMLDHRLRRDERLAERLAIREARRAVRQTWLAEIERRMQSYRVRWGDMLDGEWPMTREEFKAELDGTPEPEWSERMTAHIAFTDYHGLALFADSLRKLLSGGPRSSDVIRRAQTRERVRRYRERQRQSRS